MESVVGVLVHQGDRMYLSGEDGRRHFEDDPVWPGYAIHWTGRRLKGRLLPQVDYATGKKMVILWPDEPPARPSVELIYNERLTHYWESMMGHIAINVNGEIFNFSNLVNENETMTPEEYYYRPALGEFAPHPVRGKIGTDEEGRPYYDKFGRLFMRSVHILRISDIDPQIVRNHLQEVLKEIHAAPRDPKKPENYAQFSVLKRSCATYTRDALRAAGLKKIAGIMPRDLFVNAAYHTTVKRHGSAEIIQKPQLVVPEAPRSAPTALLNPLNRLRSSSISYKPQ